MSKYDAHRTKKARLCIVSMMKGEGRVDKLVLVAPAHIAAAVRNNIRSLTEAMIAAKR
ncbi:MAG: hypothetical protein JOZ58_27370 [Acetobacteraceae bacterium]|nr:hypothetical protein [Acetobacteraceae bacterium]MBV8578741.1 hypothetical protein [Acetobacteraceae bacterium]